MWFGAATTSDLCAQLTRSIPPPGAETHVAIPGEKYDIGGLRRWLLGGGYRDIWKLPLEIPVLDFNFAGGLTPISEGGYGQTRSVKFMGADGVEYAVRSIDKDPTRRLDSIFQGTVVAQIVQDGVAQFLPTAALVTDPLLEAAGILHANHRLVVLPDDPRLGEFREDYAGMIGMLTEQPQEGPNNTPGFAASRQVSSSENFLEDLEEGTCDRADARGYLKARLMDLLFGDRDRHARQFRWARFPDGADCFVWHVIPEDRDQAFLVRDGFVGTVYRLFEPSQTKFGLNHGNTIGMTFTGWELDRRILPGLDPSTWIEVAEELQRALTDEVIEHAVRRLPASHYELRGSFLETGLKSRRDQLVTASLEFYRLISRQVDVTGTDRDERALIEHLTDGRLRLQISYQTGPRSEGPYFDHTFDPDVTSEVRLYLRGGDDVIDVQGQKGRIRVNAVGGGGDDRFTNRSQTGGKRTRFYDDRGDNLFEGLAHVDERRFDRPRSNNGVHRYALDWGGVRRVLPTVSADPDIGVYLGLTVGFQRFGFRKVPFASDNAFTAGVGSTGPEFLLGWRGLYRERLWGADLILEAQYTGLDVLRFTGFGNDTFFPDEDSEIEGDPSTESEFFQVEQEQIEIAPSLQWAWGTDDREAAREQHVRAFQPRMRLGLGPIFKYSNTPEDDNEIRFIGTLDPAPRGMGGFSALGARAWFAIDNTDAAGYPSSGVRLETGGTIYPALLDAESAFGELHGTVSTYLTPGSSPRLPTLALRAGAKTVLGSFPFYESAFLGGSRNVRGLRSERFAGESAAYGNAELRLPLVQFDLLFPAEIGALGAVDAGRVFFEGDSDGAGMWHTSVGGGLWFSFLNRTKIFSASVLDGRDGTRFYFKAGLHF